MNERLRNQHPQGSHRGSYVGIAICIGVTGALSGWHWTLHTRIEAAAAELSAVEARWRVVSMQSQEATQIRPRLEAVLTRATRIAEERSRPRWTQALRSVVTAAGTDVELRDIHAQAAPGNSDACELRIDGRTTGRSARITADGFRESLQTLLQRDSNGKPVLTRFERLEEEPDLLGTPTGRGKVAFTIVATVGLGNGNASKASGGP